MRAALAGILQGLLGSCNNPTSTRVGRELPHREPVGWEAANPSPTVPQPTKTYCLAGSLVIP